MKTRGKLVSLENIPKVICKDHTTKSVICESKETLRDKRKPFAEKSSNLPVDYHKYKDMPKNIKVGRSNNKRKQLVKEPCETKSAEVNRQDKEKSKENVYVKAEDNKIAILRKSKRPGKNRVCDCCINTSNDKVNPVQVEYIKNSRINTKHSLSKECNLKEPVILLDRIDVSIHDFNKEVPSKRHSKPLEKNMDTNTTSSNNTNVTEVSAIGKVNFISNVNLKSKRKQKPLSSANGLITENPTKSIFQPLVLKSITEKPNLDKGSTNSKRTEASSCTFSTNRKQTKIQQNVDVTSSKNINELGRPKPGKDVNKTNQNEGKILESTNSSKIGCSNRRRYKLREAANKNYLEETGSSLNISNKEETPHTTMLNNLQGKEHIPIYNQCILKIDKEQPKGADLYEFDFNDSVDKKEQKKQRAMKKKISINVYDKTMDEIMEKIKNKIEKKKNIKFVKNIKQPKIQETLKNKNDKLLLRSKVRNIATKKPDVNGNPTTNKKQIVSKAVPIKNSNNFSNNTDLSAVNTQKEYYSDNDNDDFGFVAENYNQINVISDIIINPPCEPRDDDSIGSLPDISFRRFRRPNANSTILGSPKKLNSPWRFDHVNLKRNPHLLSYKKSALPNYEQEMVIDSTLIENSYMYKAKNVNCNQSSNKVNSSMAENFNQGDSNINATAPLVQKSCVQSSILDFISASPSKTIKKIQNLSLFDEDLLSPIKKQQKNVTAQPKKTKLFDTENISPEGYQQVHLRIESTPLGPHVPETQKPCMNDLENYFGFDSLVEDKQQETKRRVIRNNQTKPTRIDLKEVKHVLISDEPEIIEPSTIDNTFDTTFNSADNNYGEPGNTIPLGLFEDYASRPREPSRKSYARTGVRRLHMPLSFHNEEAEEENDVTHKPKKRKKDLRSKAEEAEANKWYDQFNSMCKEVDEYELEIE